MGDRHFSGASLQVGEMENCGKITSTWLEPLDGVGPTLGRVPR